MEQKRIQQLVHLLRSRLLSIINGPTAVI